MIQKNMFEIGLQTQPAASGPQKSTRWKDTSIDFKSMLNNASQRTSGDDKSMARSNPAKLDQSKRDDEKCQYKTYNEAVRRNINSDTAKKCVEKVSAQESAQNSKQLEEAKKGRKANGDTAVEALAGVLGMNAGDVNKMLEALNINPEDMADPQKITEIADRISKALDMNSSQKQALSALLKEVSKELQEHMPLQENTSAKGNELTNQNETSYKKFEGDFKASSKDEDIKPEIGQIALKFKQCINEAASKLTDNPENFASEISAKIKEIVKTVSDDENSNQKVDNTEEVLRKNVKMEENQDADQKVKQGQEAKGQETDTKSETNMHSSSHQASSAVATKETNANQENKTDMNVAFDNTISAQLQRSNEIQAVKPQKEAVVSKNEIINQVVEKAKVTLNGDKSEMLMDLKPDNLGKLSLKVVTERGMVTAQFVAENNQVKQVLEANMQLLKDVLERQGLAVQGFSVSVGQNKDERSGSGEWEGRRTKSGKTAGNAGVNTSIAVAAAGHEKINTISIGESRIDLTA